MSSSTATATPSKPPSTMLTLPPVHLPGPSFPGRDDSAGGQGEHAIPASALSHGAFKLSVKRAALRMTASQAGSWRRSGKLKEHLLDEPRVGVIAPDPSGSNAHRLLVLRYEDPEDLPEDLESLVRQQHFTVLPHVFELGYNHWSTDDVLQAILPSDLTDESPTSFSVVGHIAHMNLREKYLPYRYLIGQVVLDKNKSIRTVVNKLDTIDNEFRFFKMERLAGDDDYIAEVAESGCVFTFDFRTVYWNSRLHTEHARLVSLFQPGEVVADVMAGVGPFALPAAKNGCWVAANDLNKSSWESLLDNMRRNKVSTHIRPTNLDGREHIRQAIASTFREPYPGPPLTCDGSPWPGGERPLNSRERSKLEHARRLREKADKLGHQDPKLFQLAAEAEREAPKPPERRGPARRLVDHFVMNLPASALEFLDAFRGAYKPLVEEFGKELVEEELRRKEKEKGNRFPLVHVHCFTKDLQTPHDDICQRASASLGLSPAQALRPETAELKLHLVRSVAPNKDMYCLTFRLTEEILFDTKEAY